MNKDGSQNEVGLRARITDSGLSVTAQSRVISTLDRLFGAPFGIAAAWLEQFEERICNRTDRESIIQDAAARQVASAILSDQEIASVVVDIALSSKLAPIANKIRVAELAVDDLSQNSWESDATTAEPYGDDVDQDWLNHFSSHAEKASSEEVRHLWARVLAGEIRQTGSFSLSSLRVLSELDQRMATTFESVVQYRYNDHFILQPKDEESWDALLESLTFLEEVGLLQAIDPIGGVVWTIRPGTDGVAIMRERDLLLVMKLDAHQGLPIIPLTRVGRQIAGILPPANPLEVLERIGEAIVNVVVSADIRRIVSRSQTGFITTPIKTLKAEQ